MARGLAKAGWDVERFSWLDYMGLSRLRHRIQGKLMWGPDMARLNRALREAVSRNTYDVVWINRGVHVFPSTLRALKRRCRLLVSYNNDDPFTKKGSTRMWRYVLEGIPCFDLNFVYREKNIPEYKRHGAADVHLLPSYYVP